MRSTKGTSRQKDLEKELARIVKVLRTSYDPEKIISFGSFATGRTHEWSDLDIAVIKDTNKQFIDRLIEVARQVKSELATDFVVYTPKEFADMAKDNYFVREEILGKGKVIYDKNKTQ